MPLFGAGSRSLSGSRHRTQTRERRAGKKEQRSRLLEPQAFIPSENTQRKYACHDATAAVIELKVVRVAVRDENTRHKQHETGKC